MNFIIASIIGAVIGYITNWLAIKMLFRPHKEIRIGGIRLPFTPGLIPNEKSRIARSVGETIGKHLLTKETIIQSLCSENMNEQLDHWVKNKIREMENSSATLQEDLKSLLGDEYDSFLGPFNERLSELLWVYINEQNVKQSIAGFAKEQIMSVLSESPQSITRSVLYNSIKDKLIDRVVEYKNSDEFYLEIKKLLEEKLHELKGLDKSFGEIIPDTIKDTVKAYVYKKRADMAIKIKKFMRHEKVRRRLRHMVSETISGKLNPMIAMFINTDKIYEKIIIEIDEFLDDEKNHEDIALAINGVIDELLKSSISNTVSELPREGIDEGIKYIIHLFNEKIVHEKFIKDILHKIESKFNSYATIEEILQEAGIDYKSTIDELVESRIEAVFSSKPFKTKLHEIVIIMINKLLSLEIKSIFTIAGDKISPSISKTARDLYNRFIENKAADVIEMLDIARIVEDKINEFDVDYAEQIILEIASKELKAITWLGALLGGIIGLLSPVIGMIG